MSMTKLAWIALPTVALSMGCVKGQDETPTAAESASTVHPVAPVASMARGMRPNMHPPMNRPRPPIQRFHPGGAGALFAAAHQLALKDDQKAKLDKLETPDPAADAASGKAFNDFHQALADQIKAGKIDSAKLAQYYDGMDKETEERQAKEVDALVQLHDLLDADQRKQLVDGVKHRQEEREARMKEHEAKMKELADRAKAAAAAAPKASASGAPSIMKPPTDAERAAQRDKRETDRLARMLVLDDDQQKKLGPILASLPKPPNGPDKSRHADMQKKMAALLDAFAGDTFDAKKADLGMKDKRPRERMQARVTFLGKLLPILKPEQREKLAASVLHTRGPGMGMGPMGGMGMGMGGMGMGMGPGGRPYTLPFEDPPTPNEME